MKSSKILEILVLLAGLVGNASGWNNRDIGTPSAPGSASYNAGTGKWTVTADGNDIWLHSDNFHYVYKSLMGDGKLTSRVVNMLGPGTDVWAKAGVMIREDLSGESKHALMAMTPTAGQAVAFQWRDTTGGVSYTTHSGSQTFPYWVRIERAGNIFTGYHSPDGITWTLQGTATISMGLHAYIGLAVTSHEEGVLRTAEFDNVTIDGKIGMGTTWTYQGRLLDANGPADGLYDFEFKLYDSNDVQQGSEVDINDLDVIDGYFIVELDFGSVVFDGAARWLDIGVRSGDSTGSFTTLSPRQAINPVPYALFALNGSGGGDKEWTISGWDAVLNSSDTSGRFHDLIGTYEGWDPHAVYITGYNVKNSPGERATERVTIGGSGSEVMTADITSGNVGIGDVNPAAKLTVNGAILRSGSTMYGADTDTHINLGTNSTTGTNGKDYSYATVSGGYGNTASHEASTVGGGYDNIAGFSMSDPPPDCNGMAWAPSYATVGGGWKNYAYGYLATIGGGYDNQVCGGWTYSTIGGGGFNTTEGQAATVGGGAINTAIGQSSTVSGGEDNTASGQTTTIGGGWYNEANSQSATVGGGEFNDANGYANTVGGGSRNTASYETATISGGYENEASGLAASVGGGRNNIASGDYATIAGGGANIAQGSYSFAAGRRAKANHNGTFVWGDSTDAEFASTGNNQFLIRASGGVGIGTTSPGAKLDVIGTVQLGVSGAADVLDAYPTNVYLKAPNGSIHFQTPNGTNRMSITSSGNVGIGTTIPASRLHVAGGCITGSMCSDVRLKKNIEPLPLDDSILDRVMGLQAVTFQWKHRDDGKRQIGLIAQDVEEVFPEVVTTPDDDFCEKGLLATGLDAVLVEAIKELKVENESLKDRIEALERIIQQHQFAVAKEVQ
jgi:hypothetical protein